MSLKHFYLFYFAITLKSYIKQSSYINFPADAIEQDELVDTQSLAKKSVVNTNKIFTPIEALILFLIPFLGKNLFTKFMKTFVKSTQTLNQEQTEL